MFVYIYALTTSYRYLCIQRRRWVRVCVPERVTWLAPDRDCQLLMLARWQLLLQRSSDRRLRSPQAPCWREHPTARGTECYSIRQIRTVNSYDIQLIQWSSSSPLIVLQNTRCCTHTCHSRWKKLRCRRTARVEQLTGLRYINILSYLLT